MWFAVVAWLGLVLAAVPAWPQGTQRYSGRVERVDLAEGLVVVDELVARGGHRRHQVHVTPETPIISAARPNAGVRSGRFEEMPVALPDLLAGDFVIVESGHEGERVVARRITIIESRPRR